MREQRIDVAKLQKYGYVIGVNDAGIEAPVDMIVSMDRLWMEHRYTKMAALAKPTMLRQTSWRVNLKDKPMWPGLYLFKNDNTSCHLANDPDVLNGCNSGFCAMNKAFQMEPREIYLFGFDHCPNPKGGNSYWFKPYPWAPDSGGKKNKYIDWTKKYGPASHQFRSTGIHVVNVSPQSQMTNFSKISYNEFLETCAISR